MSSWWGRIGPVKRALVAVIALVVGINAGLSALGSLSGGADPGGPSSSSFATGDDGVAAWSDLLSLRRQAVTRLRQPLSGAALDPAATLVIADPDRMTPEDARAVARFLDRGGRLVAAGEQGVGLVAALTGSDLAWNADGQRTAVPLVPVTETAGVAEVHGAGRGILGPSGPFLAVLGPDAGAGTTAAVGRAGRAQGPGQGQGVVVAVADSTVFQNRFLAQADNAAFALAVTAGRPVVFAESVHGYGASRGLAALPSSWKWTAGALIVAVLLGMWTYGQRFGPAEDTERELAPARREYVDALAAGLRRTGPPAAATAGLRAEARRRLLARTALGQGVPDLQVKEAAVGAGIPADEVDAVLAVPDGRNGPSSANDLMVLGRAAARLRGATS